MCCAETLNTGDLETFEILHNENNYYSIGKQTLKVLERQLKGRVHFFAIQPPVWFKCGVALVQLGCCLDAANINMCKKTHLLRYFVVRHTFSNRLKTGS